MEKEAVTPKGRCAPWRHRVLRVDERGRRSVFYGIHNYKEIVGMTCDFPMNRAKHFVAWAELRTKKYVNVTFTFVTH